MRTEQDFDEETQSTSRVTIDDLLQGFKALGITTGDNLVVHTALSSFGYVEGGAASIIKAILDMIGDEGTLMAPYFLDYKENPRMFDLNAPPPPLTGALPKFLYSWPGAQLSTQPSHPVVAVGALAELLTQDQGENTPVGIGSPFDLLAQANGKVLLLGVNHQANTMIHTGEAHADLPFWGQPRPSLPDGRWVKPIGEEKRWVKLVGIPGCSLGFEKITPFLDSRGIVKTVRIGSANCQAMSAQFLLQAVVDFLKEDKRRLFCDRPSCVFCDWASSFF